MEEATQNILIWAALIILSGLALAITSRGAENSGRRKALIPAVLVVLTMGYFLGWAVNEGNLAVAFSVFIAGAFLLNIYYRELEKRGYVLQDEREAEIAKLASLKTLEFVLLVTVVSLYYCLVVAEDGLCSAILSGILATIFFGNLTMRRTIQESCEVRG